LRLVLLLLLASCAMAVGTAPARAASMPSYPPECTAYMNTGLQILSCLINVPSLGVSVSPRLVKVGQEITVTPGILPLLKIEVEMELHGADGSVGWTHSIVISQYDAIAFTESQPDLLP
jgi:hypothetical protein